MVHHLRTIDTSARLRYRTPDLGVVPPLRGLLAFFPFVEARQSFLFPLRGRAFPLVSARLSVIGHLFAFVGDPVSLIGDAFSLVSNPVTPRLFSLALGKSLLSPA